MVRKNDPASNKYNEIKEIKLRFSSLTKLAEDPEGDHDDGSPLDDPPAAHLGHPDGPDVLAVAGGAVASAPHPSQDTAQTLHGNPSVDGVHWGRGGS